MGVQKIFFTDELKVGQIFNKFIIKQNEQK